MLRLTKSGAVILILVWSFGPSLSEAPQDSRKAVTEGLAISLASFSPPIISREKWGAKPAGEGLQPHIPSSIIIHHTGVRRNAKYTIETKMRGLQSYSQSEA